MLQVPSLSSELKPQGFRALGYGRLMIFSALAGFRPDGFGVWVLPSVLLGSKGAQRSDCEKEGALSQERDPLHRLRRLAQRNSYIPVQGFSKFMELNIP